MKKIIEIACSNFESCKNAELAGASRIELFENLADGGCTPSYGMIKKVKETFHLPIYVMIRPRGGDFTYSDEEFEIIKNDILMCRELQVDGIVFGILKKDHTIDQHRCEILLHLWKSSAATFHRAIDISTNIMESTETILNLGFERILTSGGKKTAVEGLDTIRALNTAFGNNISIMAGSGINDLNAHLFRELNEIHATAKSTISSHDFFGSYTISDRMNIERLVAQFQK